LYRKSLLVFFHVLLPLKVIVKLHTAAGKMQYIIPYIYKDKKLSLLAVHFQYSNTPTATKHPKFSYSFEAGYEI